MTNRKTTRRALFMSVISLMLCCAMLVGTTFAWFTDEVTSVNNVITAGNLDIDLEYWVDDAWKAVPTQKSMFSDELWEPGHTEVVYLKVSNLGTLALKYNLAIAVASENEATNVEGKTFKLSDYIHMGVVENAQPTYTSREAAIAAAQNGANGIIGNGYSKSGTMVKGAEDLYLAVVVYMPETVGNEANYRGSEVPKITLGINLFATQLENESDSFGSDYDANAPWAGEVGTLPEEDENGVTTITTAAELAAFAAAVNNGNSFEDKTVKLGANIDLSDVNWTPIGNSTNKFQGTFIGTGYTISNLYAVGTKGVGLFGYTFVGAHIEGVTIDGAEVIGNDYVGAVLGSGYLAANCLKNCTVKNAKITAIPYLMADGVTYDGGAKAGAVAGYAVNGDITGNKVINCEVSAYRDLGVIVGMAQGEDRTITIDGNSIEGAIKISFVELLGAAYADGKGNGNMGNICGRNVNATIGTNDESRATIDRQSVVTCIEEGLTYKKDVDADTYTLYLVPADYEGTVVEVAEGTTHIGGYAFAYNDNIEKIVLPYTVTTLNDRAFRDTSASTVVLNEGLTNISNQAFRNATNVKSVVIPSTVKTISKEAFQYSGVTELTIPANVTTIESGGLRDMKMLEKVTIEGNVDIPVYAFRACTNLKTVILTGDNVTFGGGSKGMIFTNKENGDGSAITVYVANETVKERLLAADTAAKDYGGYKIVVPGFVGGNDQEQVKELTDTLANGGDVILTDDVKMDSATTAPYGNKYAVALNGGTLDGNGNELHMECYGDDYGVMTTGGTIKNITIKEGCRAVMIMYPTQDIILDNVNIGGDGVLYPINTGEAGAEGVDLIVTNSTLAGWTSYSNIESASFTNVKFEQGTYYNNIYGRVLKPYVNTTLTNCSFIEHMNLDLSGLAQGQKITIVNCTVNGQAVTADVFTIPTTDEEYDTKLFTVDLPSWATSIADCVFFG